MSPARALRCPALRAVYCSCGLLGAVAAGAEDLDGVADVTEAVLGGDLVGPLLDRRTLDLDGLAAGPAHQVVVVIVGAAPAVDGLAVAGAQHIDLAGVGEGLQRPVDGGQPDRVTPVLEHVVELLRAAELVHLVECGRDSGPLPRRPAAYRRSRARRHRCLPRTSGIPPLAGPLPRRGARTSPAIVPGDDRTPGGTLTPPSVCVSRPSSACRGRPRGGHTLTSSAGVPFPGTSRVHLSAAAAEALARFFASGAASPVKSTKRPMAKSTMVAPDGTST